MSFLFSAVRDYIVPPAATNVADSTNESSSGDNHTQAKSKTQKDTLASASHPYASNSGGNRILVQPTSKPKNTLAIPTVALDSLQPPTMAKISLSSNDSDSDSGSENDSEIKIATPYLATAATDTPFMTLSTADDPDGVWCSTWDIFSVQFCVFSIVTRSLAHAQRSNKWVPQFMTNPPLLIFNLYSRSNA
jgi:hypothetical protein